MSEVVETYRGCVIYFVPMAEVLGKPAYSTPCLSGEWFWTVQATRDAIDEAVGPPPPPPPTVYTCPKCGAEFSTEAALQAHMEDAHPPPKPPTEEREFVETYRDVDVWLLLPDELYWAQVAVGYVALAWTLPEVRVEIDKILEMLYPPEEPPEGLLAQVVAEVKAWFEENIGERLQPVLDFIDVKLDGLRAWGKEQFAEASAETADVRADLGTRYEDLDARWDVLDTETLPDLHDTIEAMAAGVGTTVDQKIIDLQDSEEELRALGDEAVKADVRDWFPAEFLKDPLGYIGTAFSDLIDAWIGGVVRSFWEGFEEGLEEEG